MLNILKGVKFAQDDRTGDLYVVDCADGPKKLTGVQPDWNQNDSTAADYIKNKPSTATNDDSMDFLAEMGMITPVTNSTGEILISSSNEIYSL